MRVQFFCPKHGCTTLHELTVRRVDCGCSRLLGCRIRSVQVFVSQCMFGCALSCFCFPWLCRPCHRPRASCDFVAGTCALRALAGTVPLSHRGHTGATAPGACCGGLCPELARRLFTFFADRRFDGMRQQDLILYVGEWRCCTCRLVADAQAIWAHASVCDGDTCHPSSNARPAYWQ